MEDSLERDLLCFQKNSISSSSLNTYIDSALNIGIAGPIILFIVVFALGGACGSPSIHAI